MKTVTTLILCVSLIFMQIMQLPIACAQEKSEYTIAVLDLQANGVSLAEAMSLSNSLRVQVTRAVSSEDFMNSSSLRYTVAERSQMDKIFDEFDIQNTGCTDLSCAVEFGKMLSVERIIIGSVGHVGETYTISASIVDVETSRTLHVAEYTYRGAVDKLLSDGIPSVVSQLLEVQNKKSRAKLYVIVGITAVAVGTAITVLSSKDESSLGDSGTIFIQLPVPED